MSPFAKLSYECCSIYKLSMITLQSHWKEVHGSQEEILLQIPTKLNECFPIHSTFVASLNTLRISWALVLEDTSVVGSEKSQLGYFPLHSTPPDIFTRLSGLVQPFPSEHLEFDGVAINQRIGGVWRNGVSSQALVPYPRGHQFKPKPVRLTFFSVYGNCTHTVHQKLGVVHVSRQNIWVSSVQNRRQMGRGGAGQP